MFLRSITRGSNYSIRSLWINVYTGYLRFNSFFSEKWVFVGKEGARFEVDGWLADISVEGWKRLMSRKAVRVGLSQISHNYLCKAECLHSATLV